MRIIAGAAKGRQIDAPREGTRPMTGRARESVFSILGPRLGGSTVLDLFAGSGALGLEALSRGADRVVFVERARAAIAVLTANVERVGLGGEIVAGDVSRVLGAVDGPFEVVFVDPPYAMPDQEVAAVMGRLAGMLTGDGVVVLHRRGSGLASPPEFLTSVDERRYGDAVVTFFERSTP